MAVRTVLEPFLDSLEMIRGRDVDPLVAEIAEDALCVKLADIGVLAKKIVALLQRIDVFAIADWRQL